MPALCAFGFLCPELGSPSARGLTLNHTLCQKLVASAVTLLEEQP
jgi:hypothetical protein